MNGDEYPLKTIYEMVICVQMYLETQGIFWKLLDDSDSFVQLRYTVDNLMKEKASIGLGSQVKQAQVISYTDEDYLWMNSYMGMTNPEQLVHTVRFVIRLHYALRAGGEHKSLHSIGFLQPV